MNKFRLKKRLFSSLALICALFSSQITYPVFDWLDALRDKLSEPIMGKVVDPSKATATGSTKNQDKQNNHNNHNKQKINHHVAASEVNKPENTKNKKQDAKKTETPVALDMAKIVADAYVTEGIETPITRIGASAAVQTGFDWFGRKISSRQALPQLAQGVLISSVMFAVHNVAAFFLYPNWLKERWWMKGFANSVCSSLVMGIASTLFDT